jgi:hypothetical protein
VCSGGASWRLLGITTAPCRPAAHRQPVTQPAAARVAAGFSSMNHMPDAYKHSMAAARHGRCSKLQAQSPTTAARSWEQVCVEASAQHRARPPHTCNVQNKLTAAACDTNICSLSIVCTVQEGVQRITCADMRVMYFLVDMTVCAGENYRFPQPLNGRVLRVWRDGSKKAGYLPEDAASAASAGGLNSSSGLCLVVVLTSVCSTCAFLGRSRCSVRAIAGAELKHPGCADPT